MAIRWLSLLVLGMLLLVPGTASFAQTGAELCTQPTMVWDEATGECHLLNAGVNESGISWTYDVAYPVGVLEEPFIQTAIDNLIQNQIAIFADAVTTTTISPGDLTLDIDYEVYTFDEDIFTVVFTESTYTGGAHPNLYYYSLTFDTENDVVLDLEDLFLLGSSPLELIVPAVREQLYTALGADETMRAFIDPGTDYDMANFQVFAISEDELIFFFPPYQVAPYAAGPQQAVIPLDTLTAIWVIGDDANPLRKG